MKKSLRLFLARLFLSVSSASLVTLITLQSINPQSRLGEVLFWPQTKMAFLHLHPHSPIGARYTFLLLSLALSLVILMMLALTASSGWNEFLVRRATGIIGIFIPLIGWLVLIPAIGIIPVGPGIATAVMLFYTLYVVGRRVNRHVLLDIVILISFFGSWAYVYHSHTDPVMLMIPVFGFLSYVSWRSYYLPVQTV
jgi:hypothetical protein